MIIYTVLDSITREELYCTWSFDAMLDYRNTVYTQKGWITFMRYGNAGFSHKTTALLQNQQINYGRQQKLNIGAQYGPRR